MSSIVFKNGICITENEPNQNMLREVGWVPNPRVKYEDCDYTSEYNPFYHESCCEKCTKCTKCNDELIDCKGNKVFDRFSPDTYNYEEDFYSSIDGFFDAYIGDKDFTMCVSEYNDAFFAFCSEDRSIIGHGMDRNFIDYFFGRNKKSIRAAITGGEGENKHIKTVVNFKNLYVGKDNTRVDMIYFRYKGDNYRIFNIAFDYIGDIPKSHRRRIFNAILRYYKGSRYIELWDDEHDAYVGDSDDIKSMLEKIKNQYNIDYSKANPNIISVPNICDALNEHYGFKKFIMEYGIHTR